MYKKIIISIALALSISSCSAYSNLNVNDLKLGMSLAEASETLGYSLVQTSNSIGSNGEHNEAFQVQKRIVRGGIAKQQKYNLIFINNELTEYHKDSENFSF